jgi:hypothetical protein
LSGGDDATVIPAFIQANQDPLSAREAARALAKWRQKRPRDTATDPADPAFANAAADEPTGAMLAAADAPRPNSTDAPGEADLSAEAQGAKADAAPPSEDPGETTEADPAEALPPIEPPRSWTKDAKERWASLPRDTQEYLASREQEREREFRRSQNEVAASRKAIEVERETMGQARQHYEAALPALLQSLSEQHAGSFADIKTMADLERLAREDFPRYVQWDAQQKKLAAVQQEFRAAQARHAEEHRARWGEFTRRQDDLFLEKAPEMVDKATAAKLQSAAVEVLRDIGFTEPELAQMWNGQSHLSLRDHRVQLLIRDGVRFREAQQKAKEAIAKPVPNVQRPGVAQSRSAASDANIQALIHRLEQSGSAKDAAALVAARRKASR